MCTSLYMSSYKLIIWFNMRLGDMTFLSGSGVLVHHNGAHLKEIRRDCGHGTGKPTRSSRSRPIRDLDHRVVLELRQI
jgi:hypothetical protein